MLFSTSKGQRNTHSLKQEENGQKSLQTVCRGEWGPLGVRREGGKAQGGH